MLIPSGTKAQMFPPERYGTSLQLFYEKPPQGFMTFVGFCTFCKINKKSLWADFGLSYFLVALIKDLLKMCSFSV